MDKECFICLKYKPLSEFGKKGLQNGKQRYRSECNSCKAIKDSKYYEANKEKYLERTRKIVEETRKFVYGYLKNHPCVDCGESDLIILEFDHVRQQKYMAIGDMVRNHKSLEMIADEIKKCEVRCANCHRRVTAQRGNWSVINY
jgi:hypothetical protein